jgi:uncharacterized protein
MISFDTNIVFAALESSAAGHAHARELMASYADNRKVALCELVLAEVYCLLRNPAVVKSPLSAGDAAAAIHKLRHHRSWRIIDYVPDVAAKVWTEAAKPGFAFRKIYDARIAHTLRHHGVTEFATRNIKDFETFGFKRVWDPLTQ